MKKHMYCLQLIAFLMIVALIVVPNAVKAADPDPAVQKKLDNILRGIETNDLALFVTDATADVKKATTKQIMSALSMHVGSRMKKGYEATYLCQLNQAGHQVHLWKASFKDGGDDMIFRMALKGGKVGGFFLQ